MNKTAEKAKQQLGMPYPTATHRLRKMILFDCVQKLGRDTCYVCEDPIESVEELSIEHKLPWLDKGVDLFWDLENIAFSHRICNVRRDRERNNDGSVFPVHKKVCPTGYSWCTGHQECLPMTSFSLRSEKGRQNGKPRAYCKECRSKKRGK